MLVFLKYLVLYLIFNNLIEATIFFQPHLQQQIEVLKI